ncbi:unnamed protein product [Cylindrotheca closterium]|uniref:Uncharacterized protein n=1 Tax=Cylindrotheca closterium TaxID=2856 RepID=A0AAD2GB11_9STRA|nr:unnamed protein product [Cylindrotheca closterium]
MLPRTSQKLCENDDISVLTKKEIIFHSFPTRWHVTLHMVKTYMQATKILSDNQYSVQGQFAQPHEQQEMYPPPEDSYPPDELYPPTGDQGYYASEHYHYYNEAH